MPKTTSELFNDINSPTPYNTSTFSENNNMNETEKFTIRVNFKPQQTTLAQDEKKTQYQWGRIIGCSLLIIVGIGGSIYYLSQDNVDDKKITTSFVQPKNSGTTNNTTAITTPVIQTPKPESPTTTTTTTENSIVSTPVDKANADQQQDQTQATNENRQDNNNINVTKIDPEKRNIEKVISANVENQSVLDETTVTNVENNQTTGPITTTDEIKAPVTADSDTAALTNSEKDLNKAPITTETNMVSPLFSQVNTEILSDNVDRFLITPSVTNNEPVGNINDIVFDNNIATVYAYSDVNDLKNSMLYYVWTLNAEEVAKVRVGVIGKRWRSHSSKFVQKNMRGQWKVELQNDKGEILAISQFKY